MIGLLAAILALGAGDPYAGAFERANAAYLAGDFDAAARDYEQIIASGVRDAAVFFNLGNTYYRKGDLGWAIANYERALRLAPGLDTAAENLERAVAESRRGLDRPLPPAWEQSLLFWHYPFRPETMRWAALGGWTAFWLLLALGQWRSWPYRRLLLAAIAAATAAFATSAWVKARPMPLAVAVEDRIPVRFGASEADNVRFELHTGDRVAVDGVQGDWLRVNTVDGERGWAEQRRFATVGPPFKDLPAVAALRNSSNTRDAPR